MQLHMLHDPLLLQPKPEPEELSRLFTLISENFTALFYTSEQKHKDEVFIVRHKSLGM